MIKKYNKIRPYLWALIILLLILLNDWKQEAFDICAGFRDGMELLKGN
ncbi:hypothetical protein PEDI_33670 [Persicobacter diffluens]|uniref:Uncharacterized protein n=1 Tax=Persicobacter diffluens TaxID=981 RepID=A0AAN5AKF7_9BACT|nr:hypothetical protein PEDI_33670 [Persicobacter diffluens]